MSPSTPIQMAKYGVVF